MKPHNLDSEIIRTRELELFPISLENLNSTPINPNDIPVNSNEASNISAEIEFLTEKGYLEYSDVQKCMKILHRPGPHRSKHLDFSRCEVKSNRLYYENLNFVPNIPDLKILIKNYHYHPSGGHHGRNKVFAEISRDNWWPNVLDYIT